MCFLGLWIIDKSTKTLCLGPLKHGEIWSIAHKNCIYLSTTIQTQVSYTICHCHIVADNAYQSNLTKNTVLKLPTNKNIIPLIVLTKAHLVWILTDSAKILLNWVFFLNCSGVHFECICKRVFWQNVTCPIQNIITSEPQLQFQLKKLQNVALVAGFNLHSFLIIKFSKTRVLWPF